MSYPPVITPNGPADPRTWLDSLGGRMDRIIDQFKKGYKTTEFWLTILTGGLILVEASTGLDLDNESIIALASSNAAYVLNRGYLKGKRAEALSYSE